MLKGELTMDGKGDQYNAHFSALTLMAVFNDPDALERVKLAIHRALDVEGERVRGQGGEVPGLCFARCWNDPLKPEEAALLHEKQERASIAYHLRHGIPLDATTVKGDPELVEEMLQKAEVERLVGVPEREGSGDA